MTGQEQLDALKNYVGDREGKRFMAKLVAVFLAVAIVLTVLSFVIDGFTSRRLMLLVMLWGVVICTTGYTVVDFMKSRNKELAKMEQAGRLEEALADFQNALALHGDELRMGELYVYARKGVGMTPYDQIRKAGLRRIPLQQATFIQYYVELGEGKNYAIYQEEEKKVNKADIEAITFHLAAKAKKIKFS